MKAFVRSMDGMYHCCWGGPNEPLWRVPCQTQEEAQAWANRVNVAIDATNQVHNITRGMKMYQISLVDHPDPGCEIEIVEEEKHV